MLLCAVFIRTCSARFCGIRYSQLSYPFGLTINGPQSLRDFKLKVLLNASDVIATKRAKLFEL